MTRYIDRTNVFHYEVARLGGAINNTITKKQAESDIDIQSQEIKNELNSLDQKLEQLSELSKKCGIYNDNSSQLQQLINQIKLDLSLLNDMLESLSKTCSKTKFSNKHTQSHYNNMVEFLKSSFVTITNRFKDTLQQRTEIMMKQENRKRMYSFKQQYPYNRNSFPLEQELQQVQAHSEIDIESGQLIKNKTRPNFVAQARQEALVNVQRAIWDLSQIFHKVAQMVSEQDMMIQRIDEETDISISNITRGHEELLKYLKSLSSNRNLIIKLFCIIFVFIILFVLILR